MILCGHRKQLTPRRLRTFEAVPLLRHRPPTSDQPAANDRRMKLFVRRTIAYPCLWKNESHVFKSLSRTRRSTSSVVRTHACKLTALPPTSSESSPSSQRSPPKRYYPGSPFGQHSEMLDRNQRNVQEACTATTQGPSYVLTSANNS